MNTIDRVDYKTKKTLDFEIVDLNLFFSTRPKRMLEKDFRLNFWAILYIAEGSGYHHVDFNSYAYKKGDLIFVQKNQVHRFQVNKDVKGYILHINEPFFYKVEGLSEDLFLEFVDSALGSPVICLETSSSQTHRILLDLLYKEYSKRIERMNVELIASLFQSFIVSIKGDIQVKEKVYSSKEYEHFKVFRDFVEKHYFETRNVEDYAHMMHLSKKNINQVTRKVVGMSAKEFIIKRVILEIKRYLSQGDLMNYEISEILGFYEAANMTKFFKHYEGMSPKAFKETLI
ncbi:AraC family transcriptional regulator [Acidaminobacter sp. JC074]|uniref:AraC family transcriptional regulator n=1 Tax=Acidaminobacter sp. JC074 TaxID=2530199 RepID=UPI001F0F28B1|nr:AraC family transcriptional regulator [Acidaminobacter sp. JC074]